MLVTGNSLVKEFDMGANKAAPPSIKPGPSIREEAPPSPPVCGKPRVRDRIFSTACDLFYQHGIREVGVDAIASEAGTNKMSFYRSFASKDELVAEYLRGEERVSWKYWDETVAKHAGNPRAQVEALFDLLVTNACQDGSRGCALANAAVEITEPDHPARPIVEQYK